MFIAALSKQPRYGNEVLSMDERIFKKVVYTYHSSILAWEIPRTKSLAGWSPWGHKRVGHDFMTKQHTHTHNGVLYGRGKEQNPAICDDTVGPCGH